MVSTGKGKTVEKRKVDISVKVTFAHSLIFLASSSPLFVPFTNCFSLYRLAPKLCIPSMQGLSWSSMVQSILF